MKPPRELEMRKGGFQIGDTVRLRSGGPAMTVCGWSRGNRALLHEAGWKCGWFSKGVMRDATFRSEVLVLVKRPDAAED